MAKNTRPADVLIVDSSAAWRNVIAQTLNHKFSGISIREAGSIEQALQMALTAPDLVITELMMPGMSGRELMMRLHSLEATRTTPVIIISEKINAASVRKLLQNGVAGILIKPFEIEGMLKRVEALLNRESDNNGGRPAIKPFPRNAVRRAIRETIYIREPVKLLTPQDICFAAPKAALLHTVVECDLGEVSRMLGMPMADAPVACVISQRSLINGIDVVCLRPQERVEGLQAAIEAQFQKMSAQTTVLELGSLTPMIGIPARTEDLSASGMRIVSPIACEIGEEITLSVQRLLRHLFSRSHSHKILAKVVRCRETNNGYEMGLRMTQAPPELLADIMQWSSAAEY